MINQQKDGGPAFPVTTPMLNMDLETGQAQPCRSWTDGMSLRDWFAGQCIDRMISLSSDSDGGWCPGTVAIGCYRFADAMLAERAKFYARSEQ